MTSTSDVYGAFIDYYGDISMHRIKNEQGWAIYAARIHSGLSQNRYIFAIVSSSSLSAERVTLNQIDWISFQTRTTDDIHDAPTHHLYVDSHRKSLLSDKIRARDRTKEETVYFTDSLPIKIRLLHDRKKNNYLQYPDQTLLYQALETYQCVIELL